MPLVLVVWRIWQMRSDPLRGWRKQMDPKLLNALTDQPAKKRSRQYPILIAWLLAVLAAAGPSWKPEPSPFAEDTAPLVILLKADISMDTADPEPSRMERAHLKIRDLAKERKGQALGLVAYSGSAHLVLPPTKDTETVATMAGEISPQIMPVTGDRLDLAIEKAGHLLDGNGGSILVVMDLTSQPTPGLETALKNAGSPSVQVLAIAPIEASTDSLSPLVKALRAKLVKMTTDDSDIMDIVKEAKRAPVARSGDGSEQWQDGGYYLVPVLALLALLPFQRESQTSPKP
ncbi:MAG: VWA domain-containing protein [Akkermansiaceae bacterium]